jgi:glycogen synthase
LSAGACIAAINTGGTADAIVDGVSGVLVQDAEELGRAVAALLDDPERRERLRTGARQIARERFAPAVVAAEVEAVYAAARQHHLTKRA